MFSYKITWSTAKCDPSIDCIEDPITGTMLPKDDFEQQFHMFLIELNGQTLSDYFDFYFEQSSTNHTAYTFIDNNSKEDFLEACMDLGLVPSMKEIHTGESTQEKTLRNQRQKSSNDLVNDFKSLGSKKMSKKYTSKDDTDTNQVKVNKSRIVSAEKRYHELLDEIQKCTDPEKLTGLKQKLERVVQLLEHST